MKTTLGLSCIVIGMFAGTANAQMLDQSSVPDTTHAFIVEDTQFLAQTFTNGVSGLLAQVKINVARHPVLASDPLVFEIRPVLADGLPGTSVLASHLISAAELSTNFEMFSVNLRPFGLTVTEGEMLAIVLRTDSPPVAPGGGINPYAWSWGSYSGGFGYFERLSPDWLSIGPDFGFSTYVDPVGMTPVPETSTVGLGAAVILLLVAARRISIGKRRQKTADGAG